MPVKALVITGPTASGKTSAAIELAHKFNGEVISADSMQIYKYMDIGTAKPNIKEMDGIPHYMLDVVFPWEEYSVAQYAETARRCIRETAQRGKLPIITGGTGMYINTLVENIQYSASVDLDAEEIAELESYARETGAEALHDILRKEDPEAAEQIHFNNIKRVIRAVGLKRKTGMTLAERNRASKATAPEIECTVYALEMDRDILYERINRRVDQMLQNGLEEEVRHVIKMCENAYTHGETQQKSLSKTALQAIGYKEMIGWFCGEHDFATAVERIKQGTRNYAKRQITWFRKPAWVNWIGLEDLGCIKKPEG
ncbi:MAG: tRNA (adenosine(37)-N6)-dimethylallyltransferase MiaA [Clostridiales bacterium]|jgi:tRNA dimethylallyltransferase|nr:tRNA (adenosine(37)-N6)-dimethylallyltransferase MiaA [Clostridiales bacterium]